MEQKTDSVEQKRQEIWAEVEAWKKNVPEGETWHHRLNNFHTRIPNPKFTQGIRRGIIPEKIGWMDKKSEVTHEVSSHHRYSQLYLSQTPRQFIATIQEVAKNTPGLDLEELRRLHDEYEIDIGPWRKGMNKDEKAEHDRNLKRLTEALHKLYDYALPLYVELRVKGYSHFDLTG